VTSEWQAARIGGDGTGATGGRYRFVNNTVILAGPSDVAIRLQEEVESLELHNNVFFKPGGGDAELVHESDMTWVGGGPGYTGSNNWVQDGWSAVPDTFVDTLRGADPGFRDLEAGDLRPAESSALVDGSAASLAGPSGHEFPSPLAVAQCLPPPRSLQAAGESISRSNSGGADIGAFESDSDSTGATGCASPPADVGSSPTSSPPPGGSSPGGSSSGGSSSGGSSPGGSSSGGSKGGTNDGEASDGAGTDASGGLTIGGGCSTAPSPRAPRFAFAALALGSLLASRRTRRSAPRG
jgi:hypothetical protein